MKQRAIDPMTWLGLGAIAAFLGVAVVMSALNTRRVRDHGVWVEHTYEVERSANAALATILDAQANFRGYLLAGRNEQLAAYRNAQQQWGTELSTLRQLTADNARQQRRIDSLTTLAGQLFAFMQDRVALRQQIGKELLMRPYTGEGERRMAPVHRIIREVLTEEGSLLVARDKQAEEAFRTAQVYGVLAAVVGLLLLGAFTVLLYRNIRSRQDAAEQAHQQQEWFSTTLASIGDAVMATNAEGHITFMNTVAADLTGWSREAAMGRPLREVFNIVNEQTRQPVENPVDKVLERGTVVGLANHTVLIAKDGSERPIDDSAAPIRSQDGTLVGVVMVFHDVTQQRQDARNLLQSEARKTAILDNALDCIITIDQEGHIVEFNPAAERTFGYRAAEVLGREMSELIIPPAYRDAHRQGLQRFIATGESRVLNRRFEITAVRFDGSEFPVELAITPIHGPGAPTFTGHLRDITERKQLEQELRQTAADLSEADRRKSEFLAILAHELRNPLAPIRNALEIVKLNGIEPDGMHMATQMMERQVGHMVRLIDDLLDVTRISRGKIELRPEPVDLGALVEQVVQAARHTADARGQRISVTLPATPIQLFADPTRITQVVGNLLNNACKFTPDGGHITVIAELDNSTAVLHVRDNGIGIAPEQLPRVFQLFTQLDPSLERTQGGLGIGLTLVKWLVELHHGTIEARSEGTGHGAEFIVRMPVMTEAQRHAGRSQQQPPPRKQHRILVVDDNRDAAESLAYLLRSAGHEVFLAHDGEEAVEATAKHTPDVLLLDIGLPKLNGFEAARRIRRAPGAEHILLVALTGWGQDDYRRRSMEAGFNTHLVKPVDYEQLVRVIADHDRAASEASPVQ